MWQRKRKKRGNERAPNDNELSRYLAYNIAFRLKSIAELFASSKMALDLLAFFLIEYAAAAP
jgi:hypothetical protein